MAQTAMITLENLSDVPQWILHGEGDAMREYQLPEYGILDFPVDVATQFMQERSRFVREYEPIKLPEPKPDEPVAYVANMTGSPFLEEEITLTLIRRGKEVDEVVDNPLRKPRVVQHTMMGGERIQPCRNDPTSKESLNLPPTVVKIPPYRRFRLGMTLADWLVKRDMAQIPGLTGQIAIVRGPRELEAKPHWPLLHLQTYAWRLDGATFRREDPRFGRLMEKQEKDYSDEADARDAATELWRAIWFRSLDERFYSPSEKELAKLCATRMRNIGVEPPKKKKVGLAEKLGGGQALGA